MANRYHRRHAHHLNPTATPTTTADPPPPHRSSSTTHARAWATHAAASAAARNNRSVRSLPPGVATGFDYNRPRVPTCADGMQRRIRPAVVHTELVCRICYNRVSELPFRQFKPRIVKVETVGTLVVRAIQMRTVRQVQHRANQHGDGGCGERRARRTSGDTRASNVTRARRTLHARGTHVARVERST
jgi:hypothetical protein